MRRSRRTLALVCALVLCSAGGCFGPFQLTREVYEKNRSVSGKAARSGVFLALILVPIYELAVIGDMLIFNPIELATGENVLETPPDTAP